MVAPSTTNGEVAEPDFSAQLALADGRARRLAAARVFTFPVSPPFVTKVVLPAKLDDNGPATLGERRPAGLSGDAQQRRPRVLMEPAL
jgi:hypothetical protein